MTFLHEYLITVLLPSCPFMLVCKFVNPELFFYITCFNEE